MRTCELPEVDDLGENNQISASNEQVKTFLLALWREKEIHSN